LGTFTAFRATLVGITGAALPADEVATAVGTTLAAVVGADTGVATAAEPVGITVALAARVGGEGATTAGATVGVETEAGAGMRPVTPLVGTSLAVGLPHAASESTSARVVMYRIFAFVNRTLAPTGGTRYLSEPIISHQRGAVPVQSGTVTVQTRGDEIAIQLGSRLSVRNW